MSPQRDTFDHLIGLIRALPASQQSEALLRLVASWLRAIDATTLKSMQPLLEQALSRTALGREILDLFSGHLALRELAAE